MYVTDWVALPVNLEGKRIAEIYCIRDRVQDAVYIELDRTFHGAAQEAYFSIFKPQFAVANVRLLGFLALNSSQQNFASIAAFSQIESLTRVRMDLSVLIYGRQNVTVSMSQLIQSDARIVDTSFKLNVTDLYSAHLLVCGLTHRVDDIDVLVERSLISVIGRFNVASVFMSGLTTVASNASIEVLESNITVGCLQTTNALVKGPEWAPVLLPTVRQKEAPTIAWSSASGVAFRTDSGLVSLRKLRILVNCEFAYGVNGSLKGLERKGAGQKAAGDEAGYAAGVCFRRGTTQFALHGVLVLGRLYGDCSYLSALPQSGESGDAWDFVQNDCLASVEPDGKALEQPFLLGAYGALVDGDKEKL